MIFPYLEVRRESGTRRLPIIPVRLFGPARSVEVLALVDSGAEHSVIDIKLLHYLGLVYEGAAAVQIVGVGGKESRGYLLNVDYQLGRHRWNAPAVFSDAVDSPIILGQAGFFAHFTITFHRREWLMDIRRAR